MSKYSYNLGFTIIEVIAAVGIFSLIALGVISLVSAILVDSNRQSRTLSNSDQSRRLSFKMMQELRNAVYSNAGAYPIATADDQQLTFYSNIDGGSDIERVRYYVQNGKLYRGELKPTGSPLTYNGANEVSKVVQNDIANGAVPIFYYFPDTYTGTGSSLAQPVNLTQINLISLNLRVYTQVAKSTTDYYTIEGSTTIRSLKTNIGD